ncbi:MAG: hypothetical protein IPJ71_06625 [Bdellovibrionales bacterium]|nr:hypothetical protein [Bdellovibrionales bacterium]
MPNFNSKAIVVVSISICIGAIAVYGLRHRWATKQESKKISESKQMEQIQSEIIRDLKRSSQSVEAQLVQSGNWKKIEENLNSQKGNHSNKMAKVLKHLVDSSEIGLDKQAQLRELLTRYLSQFSAKPVGKEARTLRLISEALKKLGPALPSDPSRAKLTELALDKRSQSETIIGTLSQEILLSWGETPKEIIDIVSSELVNGPSERSHQWLNQINFLSSTEKKKTLLCPLKDKFEKVAENLQPSLLAILARQTKLCGDISHLIKMSSSKPSEEWMEAFALSVEQTSTQGKFIVELQKASEKTANPFLREKIRGLLAQKTKVEMKE